MNSFASLQYNQRENHTTIINNCIFWFIHLNRVVNIDPVAPHIGSVVYFISTLV